MIYFARGGIFLSFDYLSFFSLLVFRRFYLCRRYIHSLDDRTETSISAVAIFRWRLTATSRVNEVVAVAVAVAVAVGRR